MRNMVIQVRQEIPMVQTRFKFKTHHYFGATELPLILASTDLVYLICKDAHDKTDRSGDIALSVTKQISFVVGAKKILLSIRKKCKVCRMEMAAPVSLENGRHDGESPRS